MRTVRAVRGHRAEPEGRLLGFRDEGLQDATALPSDHHCGAPLLDQGKRFQALKGNPVQLGNLKLAFRGLLKGPLLGRAQAASGIFHRVDLSRRRPWRALRRGGGASAANRQKQQGQEDVGRAGPKRCSGPERPALFRTFSFTRARRRW